MAFSIFSFLSGKGGKKGNRSLANTARIINILQQLVADRTMLTIKIPGTKESFSSTALEINKSTQLLRLDELTPAQGHKLLLNKKTLKVTCQSRGADLSFTATIAKSGKSSGISWYDIPLPAQLDYTQRRKHYRARVKESQRISITTHHAESGTSISGYISDISSHGICIMFNTTKKIERGDIFKYCKLNLPGPTSPVVDVYVRHVKTLSSERLLVGGSFDNPDSGTQNVIEKYVRKLERDALRSS